MKKIVLLVLSTLFLLACSGLNKTKDDMNTIVAGKTYVLDGTIGDSVIDITFEDEQLSGSAGVNRYFAPYLITGQNLSISVIGTTRRMGPKDLMTQEAQFVKALESSKTIKVDGDKLIITSTDGTQMNFTEKVMTVEEFVEGKTFTLAGSLEENKITITFVEGRIAGNGGINRYSTTYEIDGEKLTVSPQIISTMMAGPEEAMNQESAYLSDLSKSKKIAVEGDKVLITLEDEKVLIFE